MWRIFVKKTLRVSLVWRKTDTNTDGQRETSQTERDEEQARERERKTER